VFQRGALSARLGPGERRRFIDAPQMRQSCLIALTPKDASAD